MPAGDADRLRDELAAIGRRRKRAKGYEQQLAEDTRAALGRAKGLVPVTEMARLVGLERSSLYQTYGDVIT